MLLAPAVVVVPQGAVSLSLQAGALLSPAPSAHATTSYTQVCWDFPFWLLCLPASALPVCAVC